MTLKKPLGSWRPSLKRGEGEQPEEMGGRSREERPVGSDGQRAHGPQGVTSGLPSVSRTCLFQTPHTNSQTPCDLSCLAVYIPYIIPIFSSVQLLS